MLSVKRFLGMVDDREQADRAEKGEADRPLRLDVELGERAVTTFWTIAVLSSRVSDLPRKIALNRHGLFDGALVLRLEGDRWRIDGDRAHLHDAKKWALPHRPGDLFDYVLRSIDREPSKAGQSQLQEILESVDWRRDLRSIADRIPAHALAASAAFPARALAAMNAPDVDVEEFVRELVALGVGLDEPIAEGRLSPFELAIISGDSRAVSAALAAGADPRKSTNEDATYVVVADLGSQTASLLVRSGYPIGAVDAYGRNVLHKILDGDFEERIGDAEDALCAVMTGIDLGIDPNAEDCEGRTIVAILEGTAPFSRFDRSARSPRASEEIDHLIEVIVDIARGRDPGSSSTRP